MNDYFKKAGDLDEKSNSGKQNTDNMNISNVFKMAGDISLGDSNQVSVGHRMNKEEILNYLNSIVSGKRSETEFGVIRDRGRVVITYDELKKLVDLQYNIIRAEYINDMLVDVEFEGPRMSDVKGRGR